MSTRAACFFQPTSGPFHQNYDLAHKWHITESGVNLWSGALEWSVFWSRILELRFGVTLVDSNQEKYLEKHPKNHSSLFSTLTMCKGASSNFGLGLAWPLHSKWHNTF